MCYGSVSCNTWRVIVFDSGGLVSPCALKREGTDDHKCVGFGLYRASFVHRMQMVEGSSYKST